MRGDGHKFIPLLARLIDHDGNKWVTVKQLAQALGYANYKALARLIRRNPVEFQGKTVGVKLTSTDGKEYEQTILNYHGVIRATMLSDAPRAREGAYQIFLLVSDSYHLIFQKLSERC